MRELLHLGWSSALWLSLAAAATAETARPVALLDTATLRVDVGGTQRVVRIIGLISPRDLSCTQDAAGAFARSMGGELFLATDTAVASEAQGKLYRYLASGDSDVGADLIRRGLALSVDGPHARRATYRAAEDDARKAQRGLWSATCAMTLSQTMADRVAQPPPPLPRGSAANAQQAIAELQRRNESGENRVEDVPIIDVTAKAPVKEPASESAGSSSARPAERPAIPGRAVQLNGPYIRKLGQGRVLVHGKFWNPGEVAMRGQVRIELRDNGGALDSTTVDMTLDPDGEQTYSVELSPGDGVSNMTASVRWINRP